MANMTFFQDDRAHGLIGEPIRLAVIDGIPGWLVARSTTVGGLWAYAPMWYAHLYGVIAQEVE